MRDTPLDALLTNRKVADVATLVDGAGSMSTTSWAMAAADAKSVSNILLAETWLSCITPSTRRRHIELIGRTDWQGLFEK